MASNISQQLSKLINDSFYRKSIKSPNGTEKPLTDDCVKEMEKLKDELDSLIRDSHMEMRNSTLQRTINIY